jgi:hypothetical protein
MNREHPIIARAGFGAALLGVAAGIAEVVVGTAPWLGNKNDPTTLGFVTVLLALVIGAAGLGFRWATTPLRALAVVTAMLVPALLGVTTAGAAWLPAGAVAVLGGLAALRHGVDLRSTPGALSEQWPALLLGFLALIYLALGIIARGVTGVLAVSGSLAIAAALLLRHRSRMVAVLMLLAGALPFAVVAWWSVLPPLTATLTLAVGLPLLLTSVPYPPVVNDRRNETAAV